MGYYNAIGIISGLNTEGNRSVKIGWLLTLVLTVCSVADEVPYAALSEPLKSSLPRVEQLSRQPLMESNRPLLVSYIDNTRSVLSIGEVIAQSRDTDREILTSYLKELRRLEKEKESIDTLYRQSLQKAMEQADKTKFKELVAIGMEPLHHPRLRSDVIAFYQKNFPKNSIPNADNLRIEQELETKSIRFMAEQEEAWEEHLKILKRSEALRMKQKYKIGSPNSVMVVAEKKANGEIVFEAENLNPYLVTLTLDFSRLANLRSTVNLPYHIELSGKTKKEILTLYPVSAAHESGYESTYGWVKGSAFARHDDSYIYGLPFAPGTTVKVTQGYNGGFSHKGLSAYAVDFGLPVGTPIYCAREGEVVGLDVSSNLGGASPAFRPYMNYINVRHSDGTLGNYYHLKQGGSVVRIGDRVTKGQLIGYSGNTGYTTAPHLHFSVSMVDPVSMRRPMNLPIKMGCVEGIVTNPQSGDRLTAK